jgi:hypothetical protein
MDALVQQAYADGGVLDLDRAEEFFENQAGNVSTPDDRNVRRRLDDFLEDESDGIGGVDDDAFADQEREIGPLDVEALETEVRGQRCSALSRFV